MADAKVVNNPEFQAKVEKNLGRPVLALLELPMSDEEKKAIDALKLPEGSILTQLQISMLGSLSPHTWCCSVSYPPDCTIDADG